MITDIRKASKLRWKREHPEVGRNAVARHRVAHRAHYLHYHRDWQRYNRMLARLWESLLWFREETEHGEFAAMVEKLVAAAR